MKMVPIAVVALLLAACGNAEIPAPGAEPEAPAATPGPADTPAPTAEPPAPTATDMSRPTGRPAAPRPPTSTRVPMPALAPSASAQPMPTTAVGEVPRAILDRLIADLVGRVGVDSAAIGIVRVQAVTWNDGSLGCPQPGVNYSQAQVAGYQVILRANGRDYDYHVGGRGFVLCERPRLRVTPPAVDQVPEQ